MATVAQTELMQKTSEYMFFVREFFAATGTESYANHNLALRLDAETDLITLKYEGK